MSRSSSTCSKTGVKPIVKRMWTVSWPCVPSTAACQRQPMHRVEVLATPVAILTRPGRAEVGGQLMARCMITVFKANGISSCEMHGQCCVCTDCVSGSSAPTVQMGMRKSVCAVHVANAPKIKVCLRALCRRAHALSGRQLCVSTVIASNPKIIG